MIDYTLIASAIAFYRDRGYREVDVPWIISEIADDITRPPEKHPIDVDGLLRLPGSGEQGFIDLLLKKELEPGRYVTTTPCFRREMQYKNFYLPLHGGPRAGYPGGCGLGIPQRG